MAKRKRMRGGLARYASGGTVEDQTPILFPSPQAQKEPGAQTNAPLSKAWFERYGSGPEYLFLGDRKLPAVGPFAGEPAQPLPTDVKTPGTTLGDVLPLVGLASSVGKDLYDQYQQGREQPISITPELQAQIDQGIAGGVQNTQDQVGRSLEDYAAGMAMPFLNDDGTVSYFGGNQNNLWDRMDSAARDTSGTDAYVNRELDEFGRNMEMPTAEYAPGLLDRAGQGLGGAYDLYMGSQQGGLEGAANMLSGAGDLYGSIMGDGSVSGGLGQAGGTLGGLADLYGGIQQGGLEGYAQAAGGALQAANSLGYTGAAAGAMGDAVPIIGAVLGAYNTYEAAAAGDKKSAVMSGAAAGASIGSIVPVIGTAVGAVIGAVVGLIGASFGDKENPSEAAYGSYKNIDPSKNLRGWTEDQVGGAMFESIKSHSKSGNAKRFEDVGDLYQAFGISDNNYKGMQTSLTNFIEGAIKTAQEAGGLPKDPAQLRQLDGQQFFYKVVTPALAKKIEETTGKPADSNSWSTDKSKNPGAFTGMLADATDYMIAHWGESGKPGSADYQAAPTGGGSNIVKRGRAQKFARGGLSTFNEGSMIPRRGGLSMAMAPRRPNLDDSSSYYRYGAPPQQSQQPMMQQPMMQQPMQPMQQPPAMPPQMRSGVPARPMPQMMRAMGGLALYGYQSGGPHRLVKGPGTGRSDDIPARLSDGEYVFDAETVALLGDGSTDEGARRLDELRKKLRMDKGKQLARGQFSSAAKNPEEYL